MYDVVVCLYDVSVCSIIKEHQVHDNEYNAPLPGFNLTLLQPWRILHRFKCTYFFVKPHCGCRVV